MTTSHTVDQITRTGLTLARRSLAVAAYAAGLVKGTVRTVAGAAAERPIPEASDGRDETIPRQRTAAGGATGERTMFGGLNTEPAPPMMPGGGGEQIEHEPHAESRASAHGDSPVDPREEVAWEQEALEADQAPASGAGDDADGPLLDPAVAKAVRSEAETLQRAADPDKG